VDIPKGFTKLLEETSDNAHVAAAWKWCGILLAAFIVLAACAVFGLWKNIEVLICLLIEASRTIRAVPSLVIFPVIMVASILGTSLICMLTLLGVATTDAEEAQPWVEVWTEYLQPIALRLGESDDRDAYGAAQHTVLLLVVLTFFWMYCIHVAVFMCIVALTVTNWYFYRHKEGNPVGLNCCKDGWYPCRPVVISFFKVFRYHFGSLAVGALINALATIPRLLLEYIIKQTRLSKGQGNNRVSVALGWTTRCCRIACSS